ncbi:hypothetical protein PENTCL1PPCAC_16870, partial [Pristionchus entomophagus]
LIKGLRQFAVEEYEHLSSKEREYLEGVDEWMRHKLNIKPLAKYLKQKKIDFDASQMSRDDFRKSVMSSCGPISSYKWNVDPSYESVEISPETSDLDAAMRTFKEREANGEDVEFSIHIDKDNKLQYEIIQKAPS